MFITCQLHTPQHEIIFGIPNYRYKVWLFRLLIAYVICFAITLVLALLTDWLLVEVFLNKLLAVLGFIETGENEDNGSCQ